MPFFMLIVVQYNKKEGGNQGDCYLRKMILINFKTIIKIKLGKPIHNNSLFITRKPHLLKNLLAPIGDTFIGRHGKK